MLYYDFKDKLYYYTRLEKCALCNTGIIDVVFIYHIWDFNAEHIQFFCKDCITHRNRKYEFTELKQAVVIGENKLPNNVVSVVMVKPGLGGNATVFDIDNKKYISNTDNIEVIDRTYWLNKKDRNKNPNVMKYKKKLLRQIKEKDKPVEDIDNFLEEVGKCRVLAPGKTKLLGGGKNGMVKYQKRRKERRK